MKKTIRLTESQIYSIVEDALRRLNEDMEIYDIVNQDGDLKEFTLCIDNDEQCYNAMQWLVKALVKKVRKGLVPDINYLANCSTVRQIFQLGMRNIKADARRNGYAPVSLTPEQKKQARLYIAQSVLDDVEYATNNSPE